jgi:chromosomal replication initiation ATPase DnaA
MSIYSKIKKEFGVTEQELKGPSREQRLVEVRRVHWYLLRKELRICEIGREYNRRHTTVINGINRTKDLISVGDKNTLETLKILSRIAN